MSALLSVEGLTVRFQGASGKTRVLGPLHLEVDPGQTLCILGESGSGKSLAALSVPGLLPSNAETRGRIFYRGQDLLALTGKALKKIRQEEIATIFEQPMGCLNPTMTVGRQIAEAVPGNGDRNRNGKKIPGASPRAAARDGLAAVGVPGRYFNAYPHELSGGMQQRVMIAMALARRPGLLIADEPTTALDLPVQRQVLDLLNGLKKRCGTALLIITHDLGVAAEMADEVAVMYAGHLMEQAPVDAFFKTPAHPYSRDLLGIVAGDRLRPIPGTVPNLSALPEGCPYHPRCRRASAVCRERFPKEARSGRRTVRCHHALAG